MRDAPAGATPELRGLAWFSAVSVIWGLTWIPAKIGVAAIPPLLFAGSRGLAAGTLLLAAVQLRTRGIAIAPRHRLRLGSVACCAFAATYGLLFWGVGRVSSGQAAVVNLGSVPVFLLLFGVLLGEERLAGRKLAATGLGILGLVVLYGSELRAPTSPGAAGGLLAVAGASLAYALGTVLSRELLRHYGPFLVAGWTQLGGGGVLAMLVALRDPEDLQSLTALAQGPVLASWGFLVLFGSIVAFSGYLRLTRDWSPHRAGLYAFVSPCIAVLAGAWYFEERTTGVQLVGISLMLGATLLALPERAPRASP